MKLEFRTLRADEIDCRIGTCKKNGLSLLLYKNARTDMNILDEAGVQWQRRHNVVNGNLFCSLSIWDPDLQQWITREDVGTESYTEKEKGQASDSFKRAGVNFGIGRELYTSPFIWVPADGCNITDRNGKAACFDVFRVADIGYDEHRTINKLVIVNTSVKPNKIVFKMGESTEKMADDSEEAYITEAQVEEIQKQIAEIHASFPNFTEDFVLKRWKIQAFIMIPVSMYAKVKKDLEYLLEESKKAEAKNGN